MKKVLVTGSGQLASELAKTLPQDIECIFLSRPDLDITNKDAVLEQFEKQKPEAVINAAAYTAVDKAESDRDAAFAVNCEGVLNIAEACKTSGVYLLHISTDFVFDGMSCSPYDVNDEKAPLGVYGESKSEGEEVIKSTLLENWAIIRTAWVYSASGNNFVKTMLRLMAEKPALAVVGDQVGTPTWARGLAETCWLALESKIQGTFHWTDAGVASWYDFAVAIQNLAVDKGLLEKPIPVRSISTQDYPTPAKRPAYSVLDKSDIISVLEHEPVHWQAQLSMMLDELKANS